MLFILMGRRKTAALGLLPPSAAQDATEPTRFNDQDSGYHCQENKLSPKA
jgi:hypothetical protein